jgi:hypothetical protein
MGELDVQIESFRAQRSIAMNDLVDYQTGPRCFRDGVDVTDSLIERAQRNIAVFEALIAAYEAHNKAPL